MDRKIFEKFYENVVQTLISKICEKNTYISSNNNFNGLYEEYLNQKTLLKILIEKGEDNEKGELLDRHKVSACITVALIKTRLLYDKRLDDADYSYTLSSSNRMNEQLAFLSGLSCLMAYMDDDGFSFPDNTIILPETRYPKRSSYLDSTIRALYYTSTLSSINTLLLANIFFLLEKYHIKCLESRTL